MAEFISQYWLTWGFGLLTTAFAAGYKRLAKRIKAQEAERIAMRTGLLAILHDRLYQACMHYLDKGCIDDDDLKNLEYLYTSYHALGGNGTGTELYNRAKALPIRRFDHE